jgi:hypothetical protein
MHYVADGDNRVDVVSHNASSDVASALASNYPLILGSCFTVELVTALRLTPILAPSPPKPAIVNDRGTLIRVQSIRAGVECEFPERFPLQDGVVAGLLVEDFEDRVLEVVHDVFRAALS